MSSSLTVVRQQVLQQGQDAALQRWPANRPFHEDLGRWKVAWLKPRHEKAFAGELQALDFPYYLPLAQRTHRRPDNGKARKALVPLFPAYVAFAWIGSTTPLYQTGRIIRILPVPDQDRFVADLEAIQRVLGSGWPIEVHPGLRPGVTVRILRGPLAGLTGPIERLGDHCRLWVHVEMFNRSISVQLPGEVLMAQG